MLTEKEQELLKTHEMIVQAKIEPLGEMVDQIESLLAATQLQMSPMFHLSVLKDKLHEIRANIRDVYLELGGEDHWG